SRSKKSGNSTTYLSTVPALDRLVDNSLSLVDIAPALYDSAAWLLEVLIVSKVVGDLVNLLTWNISQALNGVACLTVVCWHHHHFVVNLTIILKLHNTDHTSL